MKANGSYAEWALLIQRAINIGTILWYAATLIFDGWDHELRNIAIAAGIAIGTSLLNVGIFCLLGWRSHKRAKPESK